MDAREDARRDAREDAPRSAASFLSSSPVRSGNGHARGRMSRRRRRATRPRLARARRARAREWRAPHFARRGGRATPARRRTLGERGTTRPSLSEVPREREAPGVLNRGNGKPSRGAKSAKRGNGKKTRHEFLCANSHKAGCRQTRGDEAELAPNAICVFAIRTSRCKRAVGNSETLTA